MKDVGGAVLAGSSPPFLGRERAAVDVDVGPERRSPRYHETCLLCLAIWIWREAAPLGGILVIRQPRTARRGRPALRRGGAQSSRPMEAFPSIAGGNDLLLTVAAHLPLSDLARSLRVCKAWKAVLDGSPLVWRSLCSRAWQGKMYVPATLRALAENDFSSEDDTREAESRQRHNLMGLKISELKELMRKLKMQVKVGDLIEKSDFADAILDARRAEAAGYTATQNLLTRPWLLVRPYEASPKAALRLSLADAKRLRISQEELTSLTFCVRLRDDGPLAQVLCFDPWWQGKSHGQARFSEDGRVCFTWPPDPDEPGAELNPFASMGMRDLTLGWELLDGCVVQLLLGSSGGPQEIVCRHPDTWGWILYSGGTVWTSWPMPPCINVEGKLVCSDPLLREPVLCKLPSELREF